VIGEWVTDEIDNLCNVEYGTRVVQKKDGGTTYPVYGGGGATFFMNIFNRENRVTIARFAMSAQCTRYVMGKFFLNDSGLTLSPKDSKKLNQDFLDYQCLALNNTFYSLAKGSAQKNLDVPAFRKIKISYPKDIKVQEDIVIRLNRIFEELDKAKISTQQNVKNAELLFQSYLTEIFEKGGGNWISDTIGNLCAELFAGGDVPKDRMSKEITKEFTVPIFTNGEKAKGLYGFTDKSRVTKPSITVSARGTIGYSEVRYEPFYPAIRLIVATPKIDIIELDYLKYAIKSLKFIHSGTSIPQLTVPMIKNYSIKLPKSKDEQIEIVSKLDKLSAEVKSLQASVLLRLDELSNLRHSILKKAFAGDLIRD
jgi:type I restriction enzyme S subunit